EGCSTCSNQKGCSRCPGLAYMEGNMRGPSTQDCEKSLARTGVESVNLHAKKTARAPGTRHEAPSTRHKAPSTQHPAPSTRLAFIPLAQLRSTASLQHATGPVLATA